MPNENRPLLLADSEQPNYRMQQTVRSAAGRAVALSAVGRPAADAWTLAGTDCWMHLVLASHAPQAGPRNSNLSRSARPAFVSAIP